MMLCSSIEKNQAFFVVEPYFRMVAANILKIGIDIRVPRRPIGEIVRNLESQWIAVAF